MVASSCYTDNGYSSYADDEDYTFDGYYPPYTEGSPWLSITVNPDYDSVDYVVWGTGTGTVCNAFTTYPDGLLHALNCGPRAWKESLKKDLPATEKGWFGKILAKYFCRSKETTL